MEKPAQEEIIQHTDQQITDFRKKVAGSLEQVTGRPTDPQSLNPEDESLLEKVRATGEEILDVAQSVGTHVSDKIREEATQDRVADAKKHSLMSRIRTEMKLWK